MKIYNTEIGSGRTFVIAELCSNVISHLDNLERCVEVVAGTGADAVKVQLFLAEHFPESEQDQKRVVEFPRYRFEELVSLCHSRGLACGASVFDEDAVDLVAEHGDFIKLATREWRNDELWQSCYDNSNKILTIRSFDFRQELNRSLVNIGKYADTVLYMACFPEYPAKLLFIPDLRLTAWSSHTDHWLDCVVAVSRGAVAVEKHLAFAGDDPEVGWSLPPTGFAQMVRDIRWVESVR